MSRSRRPRVAWWAWVVLASLIVAACGNGGSSDTDEAGNDGTTSEGGDLLGPIPTDDVELVIWDWISEGSGYGPGVGVLEDIDQQFMDLHPNITIKREGFPFATFWPAKVQTAIAGSGGPDIVMASQSGGQPLYDGFWPLAGLITPEQEAQMPFLASQARVDPSVHILPGTSGVSWGFGYNKDLFAEAGLDPEAPPETWDDLLNACSALNDAGIIPIAAGEQEGFFTEWMVLYGFGSRLFTPNDLDAWARREIGWTDDLMRTAWGYYTELVERDCLSPNAESQTLFEDAANQFNGGEAAMTWWILSAANIDIWNETIDNVGMFRMPELPDQPDDRLSLEGSAPILDWAILRSSDNCRAAWEYLSFLYTPENRALIEGSDLTDEQLADPNVQQLLDWFSAPVLLSGVRDQTSQETDLMRNIASDVTSGRTSLDDATEQLQQVRDDAGGESIVTPLVDTPVCN